MKKRYQRIISFVILLLFLGILAPFLPIYYPYAELYNTETQFTHFGTSYHYSFESSKINNGELNVKINEEIDYIASMVIEDYTENVTQLIDLKIFILITDDKYFEGGTEEYFEIVATVDLQTPPIYDGSIVISTFSSHFMIESNVPDNFVLGIGSEFYESNPQILENDTTDQELDFNGDNWVKLINGSIRSRGNDRDQYLWITGGILIIAIFLYIIRKRKRSITGVKNIKHKVIKSSTQIEPMESSQFTNVPGIGLVRNCCYQTARLEENYCRCGRSVSQHLINYFKEH